MRRCPRNRRRWERARALGTYARALLSMKDEGPARSQAEHALAAATAAKAPWVEADALVTLGQLSERAGRIEEAIDLFSRALQQAAHRRRCSASSCGRRSSWPGCSWSRATWRRRAQPRTQGVLRAEEAGLGLAPYGYDLQYLHYLAHYAAGAWEHAQELADGFDIRVTSPAEARLSAMALFIDVARGRPAVAERRTWLEPFFGRDGFAEYIARGLLGEHAYWHGDGEAALAEVAGDDPRVREAVRRTMGRP